MMEFLYNGIFHNGAFIMLFFIMPYSMMTFTVKFLKFYDVLFTIAFSETNLLHGGDAS